jgi:hypothetical protein
MKRLIVEIPAGLQFSDLNPEQQAAIQSVFARYVLPMPGTKPHKGFVLCDALVGDNFDPSSMPALGLPWLVIGLWEWGGYGDLTELAEFDSARMLDHIPEPAIYDEEGNQIGTEPPVLHETHTWSGWPVAF